MSNKWRGLEKPITAADAEREPESQRLFSRPAPKPSPETQRLLARIEAQRKARAQ